MSMVVLEICCGAEEPNVLDWLRATTFFQSARTVRHRCWQWLVLGNVAIHLDDRPTHCGRVYRSLVRRLGHYSGKLGGKQTGCAVPPSPITDGGRMTIGAVVLVTLGTLYFSRLNVALDAELCRSASQVVRVRTANDVADILRHHHHRSRGAVAGIRCAADDHGLLTAIGFLLARETSGSPRTPSVSPAVTAGVVTDPLCTDDDRPPTGPVPIDDQRCHVCRDSVRTILTWPCSHLICCFSCARGLRDSHAPCPQCRSPVTSWVRVYGGFS